MVLIRAGVVGGRRWDIRRAFVQDWTLLRRGDQAAARRQLDREDGGVSPVERQRPLRLIFLRGPNPPQSPEELAGETAEKIPIIHGLPLEPPIETVEESPESGPVKPGKTKFRPHFI